MLGEETLPVHIIELGGDNVNGKIVPVSTEDLFDILHNAVEHGNKLVIASYSDMFCKENGYSTDTATSMEELFTSSGAFITPDVPENGCVEIVVINEDAEKLVAWHCSGDEVYITKTAYDEFIN